VLGFCRVATLDDVIGHKYALTPGRYVGSGNSDNEEDVDFEEKMKHLAKRLDTQFAESVRLQREIKEIMQEFTVEG
jgi:type I restriction enzyme M protein